MGKVYGNRGGENGEGYMMKITVGLIIIAAVFINLKINALNERIEFICSLPIVTNKSVLLLQEREGKWVFDKDMKDSFYYVPAGC